MRKHVLQLLCISIIFNFQLSVVNPASAQGSAFVANQQHMAILPGHVKNVTFIDGELSKRT